MADWTNLPMDILVVIAQCLTVIEDFTSFATVCKSWQSLTSILKKKPSLPTRYTRIMLAEKVDTEDQENQADQNASIRCFLNLLTSKDISTPLASGKWQEVHRSTLWMGILLDFDDDVDNEEEGDDDDDVEEDDVDGEE
ncbi:F-box At5g55150 [Olea europaea subsp. europaea]|uniref:F-box At5g55150 n=1 Tax=Olea europaea subsp. europaea TaxID=158383 RepID=A0A8S0PH77_OLEEU|nr:F-box At5g55150 [Olea europaea subsp. europaea]